MTVVAIFSDLKFCIKKVFCVTLNKVWVQVTIFVLFTVNSDLRNPDNTNKNRCSYYREFTVKEKKIPRASIKMLKIYKK